MLTYALTDVGLHRSVNQDSVFWSEQSVGRLPNLFIVADGMGGHKAGDYASSLAVRRMTEIIKNAEGPETAHPASLLKYAVNQVNGEVFQAASENEDYQGMGTTLVACTVDNCVLTAVNVGDSRLYVCGDQISQITKDHSLVEEMVEQGALEKDSYGYRSRKNIITRAVGVQEMVDPDIFQVKLTGNQWILMCSDGLTNMVEDREIGEILQDRADIRQSAERLVRQANENGGSDNIAVILINPECNRE